MIVDVLGDYTFFHYTECEINWVLRNIAAGDCTFQSKHLSPVIIDAGAHIGLMTLHFLVQYPNAKIIAFEPNFATFKILEKNIRHNNLSSNVEILNCALADYDGYGVLYGVAHDTRSSTIMQKRTYNYPERIKEMPTTFVQLSSYINGTVDFLKLDIEEAEFSVLKECASKLHFVKEIEVKIYLSKGCGFTLQEVKDLLYDHHFYIKPEKHRSIQLTLPTRWHNWAKYHEIELIVLRAINTEYI